MAWYYGSIPQAIAESKNQKKLFVVFIQDANDDLGALWEETQLKNLCQEKCVALKIIADSIEYKQFSTLFPVVRVPSIVCIGQSGKILGSLENINESGVIYKVISEAVAKYEGNAPSTSAPLSQEPTIIRSDKSEEEIEADRIKLQEKLNKARLERLSKEKEAERKAEIERRKVGKQVQDMRQQQDEIERKRIAQERIKQKREDREAKERVKRLLEEDRLEKKLKHEQEVQSRAEQQARKQEANQEKQAEAHKLKNESRKEFCRLQFRMPDGTVFNHQFKSAQKFQEARDLFIENRPDYNAQHITFSTVFPKQTFTGEDFNKTLQELNLVPSTAILVSTAVKQKSCRSGDSGSGGDIFSIIFSWIMFIIMIPVDLLKSLFTSQPAVQQQNNQSHGQGGAESSQQPSSSQRMPNIPRSKEIRRRGNIARLSDVGDDDKSDESTWNGNSTQQM